MLLPEKREREYRFRLALRMGLPIFGLILILIFTTLVNNYETLSPAFYVESLLLLVVSVYFIFYLIYKGFDVKITDEVSKTFTREYFNRFVKEGIKKKCCTLILIGIDNISDINTLYGIKNGDKVLYEVAKWIGNYIQDHYATNEFPIGRIKGGDFVVALEGDLIEHKTLIELLCLKGEDFKVENIEVKLSGAIVDTSLTKNLDHLYDALFEQQEQNRYKKEFDVEAIDPNELESLVIDAIENRLLAIESQTVFDKEKNEIFSELFVRIKTKTGRFIHQKKYIKVINKLGLTLKFDTMLFETVIENIEKFQSEKIAFFINTTSLRSSEFFKKIEFLLKGKEKIAKRIVIIFSESEYYGKSQRFNTVLQAYRDLGLQLCIDRLGGLHSSFLYLRDLDVDMVRLDSAYTKEEYFASRKEIVQGCSFVLHAKGIKSWVKMIETNEQFELAKEVGADYIQGKYLSQLREELI